MRLDEVKISHFKNILDSTPIKIENNITCLVGKNESGKTAVLHALYRLNPTRAVAFSVQKQYPAWLEKLHRREGRNIEESIPVEAVFSFEDKDKAVLDARFGKGTITSEMVTLAREYGGQIHCKVKVDETSAVRFLLDKIAVPADFAQIKKEATFLDQLDGLIESLDKESGESAVNASAAITAAKEQMLGEEEELEDAVNAAVYALMPKFFYFDEYSSLPGTVKIAELLSKEKKALTDGETTARTLLELAGAESDYLLNAEYEVRKRELENVANSITHEVLRYWTTNQNLRVLIDISQKTVAKPQGQQTVLDELQIRLWDDRHLLSLPFDDRSTGFRWFFSFLAAFSEFENHKNPVIILLDEPGLGLHARAQKDFLKFIEERLAIGRQVIYSTHSPFLIQPDHLERARLVEDRGRELGSRVTSDVLSTDKDTIFPLQGALGYDLAQHLFVAPHNLVLEGTSDYTYLLLLSSFLKDNKKEGLDDRWSLVPVGGADLVPSFVALLGNHLEVTVLIDSRKEGNQRLNNLAEQGILTKNRIILIGEITGKKLGDIEDLFEVPEYLTLYNSAFNATLKEMDLLGNDPIVSRIARHLKVDRFDHGRPADALLRERDVFLPTLSEATVNRFESLFIRINKTLGVK
jgi:ABC-type multidrug transport system ATPase subunit